MCVGILFLSAVPDDIGRIRFDREIQVIQDRFGHNGHRLRYATAMAVQAAQVSDYLLRHRPSIVHFIGHGTRHGCLTFEGENGEAHHVRAELLSRLFRQARGRIRFLFLNACHTETLVTAVAKHIDCVIGMRSEISDPASRAFAGSFYATLALGESLRSAYEIARLALEMRWPELVEVPILQARNGCDTDSLRLQIRDDEPSIISAQEPQRMLSGNRVRYTLVVEGNRAEFPGDVVARIHEILRRISRDPSLTLRFVMDGSIKIGLEGDEEAVKFLLELQERGELSKVLGVEVKGAFLSDERPRPEPLAPEPPAPEPPAGPPAGLNRTHPRLLRLARRLTDNGADAERLVKITLTRGLEHFPPRRPGSDHDAWFIHILLDRFLDDCRGETSRRRDPPDEFPVGSSDAGDDIEMPSPDEPLRWSRATPQGLARAIDALPDRYRITYELHARGARYQEIALALGIPVTTVKSRLQQARRLLTNRVLTTAKRD